MNITSRRILLAVFCGLLTGAVGLGASGLAEDKAETLTGSKSSAAQKPQLYLTPSLEGGSGHRTMIGSGEIQYPLAVVRGTPYQMGYHLGQLTRQEIHQFVPPALAGIAKELGVSTDFLTEVWSRSASYTDDRVEQELIGLADGSGLPLATFQALHAVSLVMPYSCSSIAVWGDATVDGHLYQTRNLDWSMEVGAHEFPMIVLYIPDQGTPHVVPSFAGVIGAHTGMNVKGIALAEMGDSPGKEAPYQIHAPHFTTFFRTMLYDGDSLIRVLDIFQSVPPTKRYHFVFGDGQKELRAVKVRAHAPEGADQWLSIWKDNDPTDEFAPRVLTGCVYNDEGRGAFPTLKAEHGKLTGEKLVQLASSIPIKGGNVENVVYDATDFRMWVSYAHKDKEAYQRPYVYVDLKTIDADADGLPDISLK